MDKGSFSFLLDLLGVNGGVMGLMIAFIYDFKAPKDATTSTEYHR